MNFIRAYIRNFTEGLHAFCEECQHATEEGKCRAPQMSFGLFRGDFELCCADARADGFIRSYIRNTCGVTARHFKYVGERAAGFDRDALRERLLEQAEEGRQKRMPRSVGGCESCVWLNTNGWGFAHRDYWTCNNMNNTFAYIGKGTRNKYNCKNWEK